MPFRDGTFDRAYSIGVLHHTPDPRRAFDRVAAAVKPGGSLAVYLYHRYGFGPRFSDFWRAITTRLPLSLMAFLAMAAIPLYYIYRLPIVGTLLQTVLPISTDPHWRWRWLDTFDWYTPRYQWKFLYPEVFRWFRENRFRDVEIFDDPIRMSGVKV
jgi:SAM-dependent methyltransferase